MKIAPKLIQRILLKTMIFLLIIFKKSGIHRGVISLTAFVKIATHTLQTQNIW